MHHKGCGCRRARTRFSRNASTPGARASAALNVIQPPALALALITAPGGTPQVTVAEAQRLYDENELPALPESA
jgi:hypothetical protein